MTGSTRQAPAVSVVIPVRNEVEAIASAVESALAQDYAGPLEVIVADGASTDGTADVVHAIRARDGRLTLVPNPAGTTPSGLNAAIRAATGDVIVRCDAHAELPQGYVQRAVELLESTGAANVGGVQRAVGETPVQRAVAMAMSNPIGVGDARFHYGGDPGPVDTVYLGVFCRRALEEAGLFDEDLLRNQDYELNWRIRERGGVVYFHPDLQVRYAPRASLRALWRQYWDYGRWKREVLRRHPESLRWRQLAAPALVVGLVASAALVGTPWQRGSVLVPAAYAAALGIVALGEGVRSRDPAAALMPAAVATMHVSWGLGFLAGKRP